MAKKLADTWKSFFSKGDSECEPYPRVTRSELACYFQKDVKLTKFQEFSTNPTAFLNKGDHLLIKHWTYSHHAIYIGNNEVIHYASPSEGAKLQILRQPLSTFLKGGKCIRMRKYMV